MANDTVYADLLDNLSPLTKAGIDPDEARADRAGTMAKIMGENPYVAAPSSPEWTHTLPDSTAPATVQAQTPATTSTATALSAVAPGATPTVAHGDTQAPVRPSWSELYQRNTQAAMASADQGDRTLSDYMAHADPGTAALEAQRAKDATPIAAYDPATGKPLAQYKPSFGQRFMRGLEGFAGGGILGVLDPKIGGAQAYGAPSAQYGRDVATQQSKVALDDQQIANADSTAKARFELAKGAAAETAKAIAARKDIGTQILEQQKLGSGGGKGENLQQEHADAVMDAINRGVDPATDPKTQQLADAITSLQKQPAGKEANKDDKYIAINAKVAARQPLTPDEQAFKAGYEHYVKVNKVDPGTARMSVLMQMPEVVADPSNPGHTLITTRKGSIGMQGANDMSVTQPKNATKDFTDGAAGKNLTAINTAYHHLDNFDRASEALKTGNVKVLNNLANELGIQYQKDASPAVVYNLVRTALTGELGKSFSGTGATVDEQKNLSTSFNASNSLATDGAVSAGARSLLRGKEKALHEQYNQAMQGRPNFSAESGSPQPIEGSTKQNSHGDTVTFRNGKWGM